MEQAYGIFMIVLALISICTIIYFILTRREFIAFGIAAILMGGLIPSGVYLGHQLFHGNPTPTFVEISVIGTVFIPADALTVILMNILPITAGIILMRKQSAANELLLQMWAKR